MQHRRKARAVVGAVAIGLIVDAAQIDQLREAQLGMVVQHLHGSQIVLRTDHNGDLAERHRQTLKLLAQRSAQCGSRVSIFVVIVFACRPLSAR